MNCKEIQAVLIDYLDQALDATATASVKEHLDGCAVCRQEAAELQEMLQVLAENEMKSPGPALRENFQTMLQSELNILTTSDIAAGSAGHPQGTAGAQVYPQQDKPGKVIPWTSPLWKATSPLWKAAAAVVILASGIWIGTQISSRKTLSDPERTAIHKEVKEMREELLFSLLNDESASQRIKAVSYAEDMRNPDQPVINALVHTLNDDKNVNVRLAALYSLARFSDYRSVRDSLVGSLGRQTEPLIQVVLINLLAEKKDPRAIGPIQDIISNQKTLPEVKEAARKSLRTM